MSNSQQSSKRKVFADLSPLKQSPKFAWLWLGNILNGIGTQLTIVAVGLQIFAMSHNTGAVALVGGIALIPMVLAGPLGGMAADAFDRKVVMVISAIVMFASTAGILTLSLAEAAAVANGHHTALWPFYVFTTITTISGTVLGSTRGAVVPRIVPKELIPSASALNGISMGIQIMVGPALAGVFVAFFGYSATFGADLLLTAAGFLGIAALPRIPAADDATRPGWKSFKEAVAFLRGAPQIGVGFIVDLAAMSFGRPYVLLPAAASAVIGGGPITVGVLTTAGAVGSFLTGTFSGQVRHVKYQGKAIANSVLVYGGFVAMFGVVLLVMQTGLFGHPGASISQVNLPALVLASLAFIGMGASDEVSAIFRTSMLLSIAPDNMRGRLQGVFMAVVGGGPRIGDIYAGLMTGFIALWAGPVFGGIAIAVVMVILVRLTPSFRNFVA